MIEKILETINFRENWESFILQVKTFLDLESFFFWDTLVLFFNTVSNNPLAFIITLAALVGLPYTLFKAKQSNTEANDRLDQLMEEMQDYEFEKPLIDLKEKFKGGSIDNSPVIDYDQDVLELNLDKIGYPYRDEDDSISQDMESTTFVKQITLDQDVTDDFLAAGSTDKKTNPIDEELDLSSLSEDFFDEKQFNPPAEPGIAEKKPIDFFKETPAITNEDQYFGDFEKEFSNAMDINSPVESSIEEKETLIPEEEDLETIMEFSSPVESSIEEKETLIPEEEDLETIMETTSPFESIIEEKEAPVPEADDLQTRMAQAIEKLKTKYAPLEEKVDSAGPVPLNINKVKKIATPKKKNMDDFGNDASLTSTASASPGSHIGKQSDSLKKSHVITHLKSFKKNFENQLEMNGDEFKKKENNSQQEQNSSFFEAISKPAKTTHLKKTRTTDEEYQRSLESFLFLKNQEKSE